jgi:hypothetical protein
MAQWHALFASITTSLRIDRVAHYWLSNSMLLYLQQGSSLWQRHKTRLLWCECYPWRLWHSHHHTGQALLCVVLLACSFWCLVCVVWATCGQWCHMRHDRVTPFIRSGVWSALGQTLSRLPMWGHQPRDKTRLNLQPEPDLPLELGVWCAHVFTWRSKQLVGAWVLDWTQRPILVWTRVELFGSVLRVP